MTQTIEQIRKYIHETYEQSYIVDYGKLISRVQKNDDVLIKACKIAGIHLTLAELKLPSGTVKYTEQPDSKVIQLADNLLQVASDLLEKYKKFIRVNNLYVDTHREEFKKSIKKKESMSDKDVLSTCMSQAASVRDKKYALDFMDDGIKETKEILSSMWMCINTILESQVLLPNYEFSFENGDKKNGSDVSDVLLKSITQRYATLDEAINSGLFESKTEEDLLNIYKEFVLLDSFEIFKSKKDKLSGFGEGEQKLRKLIGLAPVKKSIEKIKAYALANKNSKDINLHMCFYGNPGTGKTEVARIIAQILYENKILPSNKVVEVDREGLIGQYVGETPIKTKEKIQEAMGGVLFVDEAYALIPKDGSGFDYGHEAISTLIKAMEDNRGKFCVILAGYKNEMHKMIESNPGFKSRIQFERDFPN
jgi:ATP-dependent Clp protease ATP-binding subunit ClpA